MAARPTYPIGALARRGHAAKVTADPRGAFQKDRDRLLYSGAFRRLAGKSQVVASTEIGPFHTRLTHSIKVAQLGRRIAEQLRGIALPTKIAAPDPDLVEFACLAHDIGHPAFGHAGERELHQRLDKLIQAPASGETAALEIAQGSAIEFGGFEGNPQSFRIVSRLAHKWIVGESEGWEDPLTQWFGLDLTAASLDAVSKYPWGRGQVEQKKWGVYGSGDGSDTAALEWARAATGGSPLGPDAHKSFECQVMDWCDDVTYAVHDVEDFFQIGLIPLHLLFARGRTGTGSAPDAEAARWDEWEEFREFVGEKWTRDGRPISHERLDEIRDSLLTSADGLVVVGPFTDSARDRRYAHHRTSQLIEHFVKDVAVEGEALLHRGSFLVHPDPDQAALLRAQCDLLKELIWKYVIESPNLATQQAGHRRIMSDLITIYHGDLSLLPRHYVDMIEADGCGYSAVNAGTFSRLRAAADYVSSLTEPHAIALHQRLTGNSLGGFRDLV